MTEQQENEMIASIIYDAWEHGFHTAMGQNGQKSMIESVELLAPRILTLMGNKDTGKRIEEFLREQGLTNTKERSMTDSTKSQTIKNDDDPYCPVCGGCGYIDCCGIADFLKNHVAGKTDCANEGLFLKEILEIVNESLNEEMKVSQKTIEKISGVKEVALSSSY